MIARETELLFRLVTAPLLVVDGRGEVVFASPSLCELVGRESGELIGRRVEELADDAPEKTARTLKLFSGSGDWMAGAMSLRKANGSVVKFPCKGCVVQRPSHGQTPLVAIQLDQQLQFQALSQKIDELNAEIRRRQQAEAQLRERSIKLEQEVAERKKAESELAFRNTLLSTEQEMSLDGILVVDEKGEIISFNQNFITIWSIPPDVVASRSDERALQSVLDKLADPQGFLAQVRYLYEHREEQTFQDIHLKDGRVLERYSAPLFGPEKEYYGRVWYFRDITERKRAEEALRESEERLRTLADFTYDWEYWEGPDQKIWYVTPSCERITGYSREEFMADPDLVYRIVHPDDRHIMDKHLSDIAHEDSNTVDFRILRRDGEIRWIAHGCRAVYWHGDKPMGRRASNRDITERKRLEMELGELNKNLERRVDEEVAQNREKDHILIQQSRLAAMGEMVHNIAHQWRQPLNALSIILANIKDEYDYHELTSESLGKATKQAHLLLQRMSTTVDDFRDFFRPDREPGEFDMSEAVENALFIMEASLKNNNIEVEKHMPKGLMAYGYSNQFAQVILNILANAKESIQLNILSGGCIKISLKRLADRGMLAIEDSGGGIPEDVLPKIFDPYFTTKEKGSGIGLYMSKMIIERNLNGKIEAVNTDHGALFTITLPLVNNGVPE